MPFVIAIIFLFLELCALFLFQLAAYSLLVIILLIGLITFYLPLIVIFELTQRGYNLLAKNRIEFPEPLDLILDSLDRLYSRFFVPEHKISTPEQFMANLAEFIGDKLLIIENKCEGHQAFFVFKVKKHFLSGVYEGCLPAENFRELKEKLKKEGLAINYGEYIFGRWWGNMPEFIWYQEEERLMIFRYARLWLEINKEQLIYHSKFRRPRAFPVKTFEMITTFSFFADMVHGLNIYNARGLDLYLTGRISISPVFALLHALADPTSDELDKAEYEVATGWMLRLSGAVNDFLKKVSG